MPGSNVSEIPRCNLVPWVCTALLLVAPTVRAEVDLAAVRDQISEERMAATLTRFAAHESRVVGYPGADAAARYIEDTFRDMGLVGITVHEYDVSVPMERSPGSIRVDATGETAPLHGLWPNLVKTSTLPEGGIAARLIDAGDGSYTHLDGKQVEGAIVLMDFNTGDAWLNSGYLGSTGIVFIEPDSTVHLEGERKFLTMPLDLSRWWIPKEDGIRLRQRIAESPAGEIGVQMEYSMKWERRPAWNILGTIPGTDPVLKDDVIVLESYYDAMSVVPALAPGAEQAAGITALIELAHYFRNNPPARTVVFLATSAHHLGLRGVDDFIQRYLRREDPFVDRMVIRRVVEAALDRNLIEQEGVRYHLGDEEFLGKEALVRGAETDSTLVHRVIQASIKEGLVSRSGTQLAYDDRRFGSEEDLVEELRGNEDLRLALFKDWVDPKVDSLSIKLFVSLDMSTQTDEMGLWNSNSEFYFQRYFAPFGKRFMGYAHEVSSALGYNQEDVLINGISPPGGMSWDSFVPGEISVNSEVVLTTGTPALALVTVNDARFVVDTPFDRIDEVHVGNLARQVRALAGIFHIAFEDPRLFPDFKMRLRDTLSSLTARAMGFPQRDIIPDLPRRGAVGVVRNGQKKSYKGVRGEYYELVDGDGAMYFNRIRVNNIGIEAYDMDPATGAISYAPDRGQKGGAYPMKVTMDWRDKSWQVVLFPCRAYNLYDLVDPRYLNKLSEFNVLAETNIAPSEYGYTTGEGPSAENEPLGVLFAPNGARIKVALGAGLLGFRYLLLNSAASDDPELALGQGYEITPGTSFGHTTYLAARDMWTLNEARMRELSRYGIENRRLNTLHRRTREQLEAAKEAIDERRWGESVRRSRAAIGLESRAYPDVKATQNDVIQGIVFFLALLIPCAFFAERLLITAATIKNQIFGFFGVFLAIWVILSMVHPAFEISNPFGILLAFIMGTMAVLVMVIVSGRFNESMRQLRTEVAVIHQTDVKRSGASLAAFQLGISNMKRRKLRTALTFLTLMLLTFTVLSFTSFQTSLSFYQFHRGNEGLYQGMLIRSKAWSPQEESVLDYANNTFRDIGTVAPRSWYGDKARSHIKMKHGENSHYALGVLGLTPQEAEVTGLDRALIAGRWFEAGDEKVCMLSDQMITADKLNIDLDRVAAGKARIRVFGEMFTVIGVLDSKLMEDLKDLDDEMITPADFAGTSGLTVLEMVEEESRARDGLTETKATVDPFVHLAPANVLVMPYHVLRNVGSGNPLQSVAVRFDEGVDERARIEELLSRLAVTLFAGIKEEGDERVEVSVYSSLGVTGFSGLANLFIPILIAALIVLNTMMGSVYERLREIGIYSSVGLAPAHISWLFMAESCVYSVLGVVAGYLTGQTVAKLLMVFDLLAGFTLNYSSLSAVFSSMLVMAVVMLSTIYPAHKASQMAVPDVTRKWRLPPTDGDQWNFEFPFTVSGHEVLGLSVFLIGYFDSYSEESVGTFYTEGATLDRVETEHGEGYDISMTIGLAPFDLGVSQYVVFRALPEAEHNIYVITLQIRRLSGEDSSWRRVNQRFINVIRKQFLIWRTVGPEVKDDYRVQGEELLAGKQAEAKT
jgi:hypothetical protein